MSIQTMDMQHWQYHADISWVLNKDKMDLAVKADKIRKFLSGLPPFENHPEHLTIFDELETAAPKGKEAFEEAVEVLFNFCDYYRIWISS